MAGHSKWANIQHRKGAQDAKRGKMFTKLMREIMTAVQLAGPDPSANPRLRAAIDKALRANMTRKIIDNAVAKGSGEGSDAKMEEMIYEGYGPGGIAVLVTCLSDNKNRTVSEVRHAFSKYGGSLGTDGCVAYLFRLVGQIVILEGCEDAVMEAALEAGANDVVSMGQKGFEVETDPSALYAVKDALEHAGFASERCELNRVAETTVELDQEGAEKFLKLVDVLEDLDDVQNVYANAHISESVLEAMS